MSTPTRSRRPSFLATCAAVIIPLAAILAFFGDDQRAQTALLVSIAVLLTDLASR